MGRSGRTIRRFDVKAGLSRIFRVAGDGLMSGGVANEKNPKRWCA